MGEDPRAVAIGLGGIDPEVAVGSGHVVSSLRAQASPAERMRPFIRASSTTDFGPSATILPPSMTISRSTSESMELRWVTSSRVLPGSASPSRVLKAFSVLLRSEEHTSELQSLMRISYAVFCLKQKNQSTNNHTLSLKIIRTTTMTIQ